MRIIMSVSIGLTEVKDEFEIPDAEWNAMSEAEREAECDAYLEGHISNNVDATWWEADSNA